MMSSHPHLITTILHVPSWRLPNKHYLFEYSKGLVTSGLGISINIISSLVVVQASLCIANVIQTCLPRVRASMYQGRSITIRTCQANGRSRCCKTRTLETPASKSGSVVHSATERDSSRQSSSGRCSGVPREQRIHGSRSQPSKRPSKMRCPLILVEQGDSSKRCRRPRPIVNTESPKRLRALMHPALTETTPSLVPELGRDRWARRGPSFVLGRRTSKCHGTSGKDFCVG